MFWKVYAVVYMVLTVLGLPMAISRLPSMSPIDLVDLFVFTPIAVAGLWSAAFRHISLPKNTWKVLLFVSVFWRAIVIGNALLFSDVVRKFQAGLAGFNGAMPAQTARMVLYGEMGVAFVAAAFLTLPPIMALYRNAYGNESLLKLMSPASLSPAPSSTQAAITSRQTVA